MPNPNPPKAAKPTAASSQKTERPEPLVVPDGPSPASPNVERRSGRDRRSTWLQKRRHALYGLLFDIEPHLAEVDPKTDPPIPVVKFDGDRRIDVLLALHNTARESIHQWENRIFQVFLLSEGGLLSALAFFFDHQNLHRHATMFGAAVTIFGAATLAYLYLAAKAHANNGVLLVKIEAALGLCQPGTYIEGAPFFGYTGFWVDDWRTPILLLIHSGVVAFAAYAVFTGLA
jgi:hypothetical protein